VVDNKVMSLSKEEKVHIVLVGNPGVGKSTILNSLCGQIHFRSGVSYGSGLTTCLQEVELANLVYADTPGLADAELREQAAKEIERLFRSVRRIKLVFVITLEAGRVRPADLATIKLVLDALGIQNMTNQFAIIINKVSNRIKEDLKDSQKLTQLLGCLNALDSDNVRHTQFVRLLANNAELDDVDNALVVPQQTVLELIACLPDVRVDPRAVKPIAVNELDNSAAHLEAIIDRIQSANQEQLAAMRQQQEEVSGKLLALTEENNRLVLGRQQQDHEARLALAEQRHEADLQKLRLENSIRDAEMKAEAERKLFEARLAEQERERERHMQRMEEARWQQEAQMQFLGRQNEAINAVPVGPGAPGPLDGILNVLGHVIPAVLPFLRL
jgi:GTP-binding protein EngB required for normal cell division